MQAKRFHAYQTPKKSVNNTFQLKVLIKKNIKTLKGIECHEVSTGSDFMDSKTTEDPRLAKLIKRNKFLSSFRLVIYSHNLEKSLPIFPALKNLHSLTRFCLEFFDDQSFKPKLSHAFTHCTKNLKHLTNFGCSLSKSVRTLHFIAPLHRLSHLYLNRYSSQRLTDKSWSAFAYHLPDLTSLSLNLSLIENLTQKNLLTIFSSLSRLPRLTSLDLKTIDSGVLDFATLISLFENLKNLSHFQSLTLSLSICNRLKLDGKDPLAIGLALLNASSFRKLSLEFYSNFTDYDLSELLIVIQRFSSLKYLSLRLSEATTQGITNLAAAFSKFPALQELRLSISPEIENESFFESIPLCLKNLPELVSLTFDISMYSNQTIDHNVWVQSFCSQLASFSKLQYLDLNFGSKSRLDTKSMTRLSQALLKLTDLNTLCLNCNGDETDGDDVFDGLIKAIGLKTNLKELNLLLSGYFDLKKETVENVTASLKSLNGLTELYLNLEMYPDQVEIREQFKNLIIMLESQEALLSFDIAMPSFMQDNVFREDKSFMELIHRVENGAKRVNIYGI